MLSSGSKVAGCRQWGALAGHERKVVPCHAVANWPLVIPKLLGSRHEGCVSEPGAAMQLRSPILLVRQAFIVDGMIMSCMVCMHLGVKAGRSGFLDTPY